MCTGLALIVFMGLIGAFQLLRERTFGVPPAPLITLLVSLLHYAYDGIILRVKPKPKAA